MSAHTIAQYPASPYIRCKKWRFGDAAHQAGLTGWGSNRILHGSGYEALYSNIGSLNTATGVCALYSNYLKSDPEGIPQYGLIAEEVDKVYPDLVVRNEQGQIEGVRYEELAPILLKEVREQHQALVAQEQQFSDLKQQLARLVEANRQIQASLAALHSKQLSVAIVRGLPRTTDCAPQDRAAAPLMAFDGGLGYKLSDADEAMNLEP